MWIDERRAGWAVDDTPGVFHFVEPRAQRATAVVIEGSVGREHVLARVLMPNSGWLTGAQPGEQPRRVRWGDSQRGPFETRELSASDAPQCASALFSTMASLLHGFSSKYAPRAKL
jgi:hypothetical protein